jgi:hypothetical protein
VYNHCNICNISIYFCNIHMKQFQHTPKHLKHLKQMLATCAFKRKHLLAALTKMEARRHGARRRCEARCHGVTRRSPMRTDLGRGRDRRMERGHDGRHEFRQGHVARARTGSVPRAGRAACRASGRGRSP